VDAFDSFAAATEAIAIAALVAASYASTNLDNFVVLSAYCAKSGYRPFLVKLTFVLVCFAVILVSLALARAADAVIADQLRYLGVVPIGIGLYNLAKLLFFRPADDAADLSEPAGIVGWPLYLGIGLALLANSSDSVVVLAPIFADLRTAFVILCATAAIAVAIAMSSVADMIANHPLLRARVEKVADWALPFLLIAIGLMILADKPADAFVEVGGSPGAVGWSLLKGTLALC
jgi:cadmium resistance protein CadD (predicted permease)